MNFLISLLLNGIAVFLASALLTGVHTDGYLTAIIVGLLLGIVNIFIKPILVLLTLPITILTLGLFYFVLNGAMVLLVDGLISGFAVDSLFWAIGFSLVLSMLNFFIGGLNSTEPRT